MKIAAITNDGKTISQHFGRAPYYLVMTIDNGEVINQELREKISHAHFSNESHDAEQAGQPHGFSPVSQERHSRMAQAITDCEVLLCRGMGKGAYESMKAYGIRPIVTDIAVIDEAVNTYLGGRLENHIDQLH
jgi:predicted Fe-Mo cluster-binding NifX family protein